MATVLEFNGYIINWEIVARFTEALAWPVVTLLAVLIIRPGRLITHMLKHGGKVSAGPAAFELNPVAAIQNADNILEEEEEAEERTGAVVVDPPRPEATIPANADSYELIIDGWTTITEAIDEAVSAAGLPKVDWRNTSDSIELIRSKQVLSRKIIVAIENMRDVRNLAKKHGSEALGQKMTQDEARKFARAANRLAGRIRRYIVYKTAPHLTADSAEQRPN